MWYNKEKRGFMNSKFCRYSFGFLFLILILSAFYFEEILLTFVLSVILIIISIREYRKMFEQKQVYIHKILPEVLGILMAIIFCFPISEYVHNLITPILVIGIITTFLITIMRNKKPYILTSTATIMSFLFVFFGLYVIKITYQFNHEKYYPIIVLYFLAILLGDFLASKIGPKFNSKLAPEISPNKTIAGAITNIITVCGIFLIFNVFVGFSIFQCLILGLVISISAQLGDLAISSIKRDIGIKHSGTLFLEFGGILDRIDAFIFSAPATYYCLCLFS